MKSIRFAQNVASVGTLCTTDLMMYDSPIGQSLASRRNSYCQYAQICL